MTDTYEYGICCQYSTGEFKITVNGESVATSSIGEFRDVIGKATTWSGAVLAPPWTTSWTSRTMTNRIRRAGRSVVSWPVLLVPRLTYERFNCTRYGHSFLTSEEAKGSKEGGGGQKVEIAGC
jgi:hypothetical protein